MVDLRANSTSYKISTVNNFNCFDLLNDNIVIIP